MGSYQEHALDGASAVDLVVALYDGIIRFLYAAIAAVERGDAEGRRGPPSSGRWISSFTCRRGCAWMWADGRRRRSASSTHRSSRRSCRPRSRPRGRSSSMPLTACKNVRDAWRQVAKDPEVNPAPPQVAAFIRDAGSRIRECRLRDGVHRPVPAGTHERQVRSNGSEDPFDGILVCVLIRRR